MTVKVLQISESAEPRRLMFMLEKSGGPRVLIGPFQSYADALEEVKRLVPPGWGGFCRELSAMGIAADA